jgi:hypothetical protein
MIISPDSLSVSGLKREAMIFHMAQGSQADSSEHCVYSSSVNSPATESRMMVSKTRNKLNDVKPQRRTFGNITNREAKTTIMFRMEFGEGLSRRSYGGTGGHPALWPGLITACNYCMVAVPFPFVDRYMDLPRQCPQCVIFKYLPRQT